MPDNLFAPKVGETPAERLRSAASYIREHFRRDRLSDDQGNVCATGAILCLRDRQERLPLILLAVDQIAWGAASALAEQLHRDRPDTCYLYRDQDRIDVLGTIFWFNDRVARDGAEVAEVMEKAAAGWEEARDA